MSDDQKPNPPKRAGILFEGVVGSTVRGAKIRGHEIGVQATNSSNLSFYDLDIADNSGEKPDDALLISFRAMIQNAIADLQNQSDITKKQEVEKAMEKSGLKTWCVEHGVDVASVIITLMAWLW